MPLASGKQRLGLCFAHVFYFGDDLLFDLGGKFSNRGRVEQRPQRQVDAERAANLYDELRSQQRVSAEQKKIIANAHFTQIQQRTQGLCQSLSDWSPEPQEGFVAPPMHSIWFVPQG